MTVFSDFPHCTIPGEPTDRWIQMTNPSGTAVEDGLADLKDYQAELKMRALIKRAMEGRFLPEQFGEGDIDAPVGKHCDPLKFPQGIPWMAELRVNGIKNSKMHYRVYFGDVSSQNTQVRHRMVATQFDTKHDSRNARHKQTQSMTRAAKALVFWCNQNNETFRVAPPSTSNR